MSWWNYTSRGKQATDAENEYLNSIVDKANSSMQLAESISPENNMNNAQELKDDIVTDTEFNQANESNVQNNNITKSGAVNNVVQAQKQANENRQKVGQFAKQLVSQQNDDKNKTVLAAKNLASEEAKMKYETAVQRYNQAKTNLLNIAKTLTTFGLSI